MVSLLVLFFNCQFTSGRPPVVSSSLSVAVLLSLGSECPGVPLSRPPRANRLFKCLPGLPLSRQPRANRLLSACPVCRCRARLGLTAPLGCLPGLPLSRQVRANRPFRVLARACRYRVNLGLTAFLSACPGLPLSRQPRANRLWRFAGHAVVTRWRMGEQLACKQENNAQGRMRISLIKLI